MMMSEQRFRKLCRGELGGYESAKFQKSLDENPGDPIPVTFEVSWRETRTLQVPREEAEQYAKWAKEEAQPEQDLLEYIKPQMDEWIKSHRPQMCDRLKSALEKHNPDYGPDIQLIWPIATPDVVPMDVAKKYIERYS